MLIELKPERTTVFAYGCPMKHRHHDNSPASTSTDILRAPYCPAVGGSTYKAHLEAIVNTVLSLSARLGENERRLLRKQLVVGSEYFLR
jgi:hypothetical protein